MSALSGDRHERERNFHGTRGEHLFPHPSQYEPRSSRWNSWEKRYAAHLDRHKELARNPEPMEGDSEAVTTLFGHIAELEQIIAKEKLLIRALREREAAYPEADHTEDDSRVQKLTRMIRDGGRS